MTKKLETLIEKKTSKILDLLGISAKLEINQNKDMNSVDVNISVDNDATGLLIGAKGRNLFSLQTLLNIAFREELGEDLRILVDVDDWRKKEFDRLYLLADNTAQRATETGEKQALYNLSAFQRRMIHTHLKKNKSVKTESQGEGDERFIEIIPQK